MKNNRCYELNPAANDERHKQSVNGKNDDRIQKVLDNLSTIHFDDLLRIIGELGRYQKIRLFMICLVSMVCAFHAQNMVFVGAKPKQSCLVPKVNVSGPHWENINKSDFDSFIRSVNEDDKGCYMYDVSETVKTVQSGNVTFDELIQKNRSMPTEACTSWTYSRVIYGPTIVSEFDLVCDKKWMTSFSKTLYFFGRLLGAIVFGQLADVFGRRPMFLAGLIMLLIVGCVAAASPNIYVFIPFYILQGAAQTGLFLVGFVMCTELVGPKYRLGAGFLVQCFYAVGYMLLSLLAYLIRDWRFIEATISIPVVAFSIYLCFLTESVRWLLSKNREEEAKKIIKKVIASNKPVITDEQMNNISNQDTEENVHVNPGDRKYTIVDLLHPCKMTILSVNVWFNWMVNSLVYYGLGLGTENLGGDPYINFCIAGAVEIPAYIVCILLLNRLGRKLPLCFTMVFGGIMCIVSGFLDDILVAKIAIAMVGKFMITASYAIIYLWAAEVFPTVVRNTGVGVSSMCARIGGMIAPQILELNSVWSPLPVLIFGVMSILAGVLALNIPESAGKPLPQTIEDIIKPGERTTDELKMDESQSTKKI